MFKIIRATRRGNQIARESSTLAMEVVNGLIQAGADVRASDSGTVVREAFAFYSTMSVASWMNDLHRGQMVVHASDMLKEWFVKVSLSNATPEQRAEGLSNWTENLTSYWKEWLEDLVSENPGCRGFTDFREPAAERLVTRLGVHFQAQFPALDAVTLDQLLERARAKALTFVP